MLPTIAIVANPKPENAEYATESYVDAQYVRWIEQSAANVIVIQPWFERRNIDEILTKVNGVLIQGGSRDLRLEGQYESLVKYITWKIMELFDKENKAIPLWGTCQGFELFHVIFANTMEVLGHFRAENIRTPLAQVDNVDSLMYRNFSDKEIFDLTHKDTTAQFHHLGISADMYDKYPKLKEIFKITAYGKDLDGKMYVASVEGIRYPIYSLQFHPEMISYHKFETRGIPQTSEAVKISQNFSNFFIQQTLLNDNHMTINEMKEYQLINTFTEVAIYFKEDYYFLYKKPEMKFLA